MPHDDDALILALLPIVFGDPLPPLVWLRPRRRVRLRRRQAIISAALARSNASTVPAADAHGYDRQ